jgi:hypothetical protein
VISVGYCFAFASRNDCVRDTLQDLVARHVRGFSFEGGAVPAETIPITPQVTWPFVVDVYYNVPWGMHAAHCHNRYVVSPWGRKRTSHKAELTL